MLLSLVACEAQSKPPREPVKASPAPVAVASPTKPKVTDVSAEDYEAPPLPRGRVTVFDVYGGRHVVDVEIAATRASRTRGLMWRSKLSAGQGMLFIFTEERRLSFWMRNTLIPLDMLFITQSKQVAGIVENAVPRTTSSRGVATPSTYVLEVPGGWAAENKVQAGGRVELEGLVGISAEPD